MKTRMKLFPRSHNSGAGICNLPFAHASNQFCCPSHGEEALRKRKKPGAQEAKGGSIGGSGKEQWQHLIQMRAKHRQMESTENL